jgi:hypothetical protein
VYSVPFSAIDTFPANQLHYSLALDYGHLVLANRIRRTFEVTLALPLTSKEIQQSITARYRVEYESAMRQLFAEAPEYIYMEVKTRSCWTCRPIRFFRKSILWIRMTMNGNLRILR